jgi:hypothetical protein
MRKLLFIFLIVFLFNSCGIIYVDYEVIDRLAYGEGEDKEYVIILKVIDDKFYKIIIKDNMSEIKKLYILTGKFKYIRMNLSKNDYYPIELEDNK